MVNTFLEFELDHALYELRFRGEVVATQARVFALIQYLIEHRDRVVSKDELMQALWKDTTVSETAISQVVMMARKALRDESGRQQIIKTVRARGFRFVAKVAEFDASLAPSVDTRHMIEPQTIETRAPLFGRARELHELSQLLDSAEHGRGGLVLLDGEPGVGKTTLAAELAHCAQQRGADVIWGRAWEEGGAPPFWPWMQVLRALLLREGAEGMRAALGSHAHELGSLLPELAPLDKPGTTLDGPKARFAQFDAIARLLRNLGSRHPSPTCGTAQTRVIILDDLHAVDDASVQLLRFVLPELHELRLLFVATFRDLELVPGSALAMFVDSCAGTATRMHLQGIAADEAALLLERLGQTASPHDVHALYELSQGNPLLLCALSQRLQAEGRDGFRQLSELAAFSLPERIAGSVQKHLLLLPDETRAALSAASAFGREFPLPTLASVLSCSETQLLERLEPARRRGLVRPAAQGSSHRAFSHALVCSAVYSELAPKQRVELHRRIAELLESNAVDALPLYELAHHYQRAAADGCRSKAIEFSHRAALQAESMMAFEVAAALYQRAFEVSQLEAADSARSHVLLCGAGDAWYRAGELERAVSYYDHAADLARSEQHAERFAWAVTLSATALRGTVLHDEVRQNQLRQALELLPEGESYLKALLMAGSMLGSRSARSLPERKRVTECAVAMARRLQDDHVLQWTLNAQHLTLWGAAPPQELLAIANEMLELGVRTGDKEVMLDAMLWRLADCIECGDMQAMSHYHDEYAREAEHLGSPWHRYMALGSGFYEAVAQGELERADALSEQVRKLGGRVREPLSEGFYEVRALFLRFHRGPWHTQTPEPPESVPADYRVFWALAAAMSAQPSAARRTLQAVLAADMAERLLDSLRLPVFAVLAQVAVMLDEHSAIERLYALLLPERGRHLHLQAWVYLGPVSYYLGLMAIALHEHGHAAEHLERALDETVHVPTFHLYAQVELARSLIATGARARARELLETAARAAMLFGMAPLQARVATLLTI